eukprot:4708093-Alexandrium_andersonii.AAC.1
MANPLASVALQYAAIFKPILHRTVTRRHHGPTGEPTCASLGTRRSMKSPPSEALRGGRAIPPNDGTTKSG